jgi:hypothetical protein
MPKAHRQEYEVVSHPTEQRPERGRTANRGAPDREGDGTVAAPEPGVEQRKRGGQHHRAADALQTRLPMSSGPDWAKAASTLAAAKTIAPVTNSSRRP